MDYSLAKYNYDKKIKQDSSLIGKLFIVPHDLKNKMDFINHLRTVKSDGLELKVEDVTIFVNQSAINDNSAFDLQEIDL